ncbi:DEAD-box helicase-like protein [Leishmania major strain Friedlin]|uniref:ATP-dependent RNA helicase n=1 Tax=Leishmania major TaxID=5664 RepID=E9ACY2_LEIMA|nr:DEAD-box helicase-like protein [Leishmania major strain Friedlin]CAG9576606.1 DEAD-box_helicase-like_protein [Leishmania major strain Friedlin]CBZ12065.1 DEAD-box helicase-like protein [Leishmania major strain Friedlin]|eukprot:XP_003721811.1 DEAD-box helicase-like protein [Leishmania major strain Friedlin]
MSSYVSVSGLSKVGEDDALQRLLSSREGSGNGSNALLEAMRKIQAENVFDAENVTFTPAAPPAPVAKAASKKESAASHASVEKPKANAVSLREPKKTSSGMSPSPTVQLAASAVQASSFRATNPTDIDSLPALVELVHPKLLRPLTDSMKIEHLTRIQKLCWAAMLDSDSDVLVRSETGSGKTLAYALPTLHRLLVECDKTPISRDVGTLIIIMCPTRELVLQVTETVTTLVRCAQFITVGGIHGGENRHKEKARLRKGLPILVTTPGRLLDHLKTTASFTVAHAQTVIMDEADRLLDMGFEKALREIMELLERKCHHASDLKRVLVSATITDGVERLSHFALRRNIARIGETQDTFSVPTTLKQHYVIVPVKHRLSVLLSFLRSQLDAGANKIIVFVSTADSTEFLYLLASRLQSPFHRRSYEGKVVTRSRGASMSAKKMVETANRHLDNGGATDEVVTFEDVSDGETEGDARIDSTAALQRAFLDANVFKLHGNMLQVDRAAVFHAFKFGTRKSRSDKSVLFCTDVAARGLDMPRIDWIVHYDPPIDPTSYVHRIGRTARIGNSGDSILFLAPDERGYAAYLTHFIHSQMQQSDGKEATEMAERKYETFLFYLTKLDPKSNHMWMQSTAALERAISRLAMQRDIERGEDAKENLYRVALFAYQSYLRAYAGMPRQTKSLFFSSTLHLGHVAQSFGIDKSPSEVQRELQAYIREDRALARDNRKGTVTNSCDGERGKSKRQRVELDHEDRYHSMLTQKQRKLTRDWAEKRRKESTKIRPLQFSEFDA